MYYLGFGYKRPLFKIFTRKDDGRVDETKLEKIAGLQSGDERHLCVLPLFLRVPYKGAGNVCTTEVKQREITGKTTTMWLVSTTCSRPFATM